MDLTRENYYSKDNTAISNSKVTAFLQSKEFYKARFIDGTAEKELTPAMILGSLVDAFFSDGFTALPKGFYVKEKRGEDGPGVGVTQTVLEKAQEMAVQLRNSPFYEFYYPQMQDAPKSVFQQPLWGTVGKGKNKVIICGMPDVVTFSHDVRTIWIDDLKTTANAAMRNAKSWYWHCKQFGYFRQLYAYSLLMKQKFPEARIVCRHVVIGTKKAGLRYPIKLYEIPASLMKEDGALFVRTVKAIAREKEWKDAPADWRYVERLTAPKEKVEFVSEE